MRKKKPSVRSTARTKGVQYSYLRIRYEDSISDYTEGDLIPIIPVLQYEFKGVYLSYLPSNGPSECGSFCITREIDDHHVTLSKNDIFFDDDPIYFNVDSEAHLNKIKEVFSNLDYKVSNAYNSKKIQHLKAEADRLGFKLVKK